MPHAHDGKVIVFAPFARDAESIEKVLAQQEMTVERVHSVGTLASCLGDEVGAVVMSEEALAQQDWQPLVVAAKSQPSWSAYPFILLIGQKRSFHETQRVSAILPAEITNVMVLERPMGSATLISAVRWALAGRRRQFVTRNHMQELERRTKQQQLMTRELAHRVKNTMAILQSIVAYSLRSPDASEVRKTIIERFGALSRAHDILIGTDFAAADFRELATTALSVQPGMFDLDGPDVRLSPQTSLSFALVLHELATNSLKYGALQAGGKIHLRWKISGESAPEFTLKWSETGGPPAVRPAKVGFGTRLIESTLRSSGKVELRYEPSGFELLFVADLNTLTHTAVVDLNV
ncbi:sensor histidine kinase [Pseudaminobacter sp. 19-2017]|uniref:histidine kinase n=1 Tax=Pseudaminobacter soli (ex Zhang et al. 2022) TaxID=2831468 RepID=A0A942IC90_9HYPH|nr:sensor histidine kinase [Pseudaminobacter soli]MBS3652446.1 sensor histidine kinase [Pseudaminobacter soli]